MNRRRVTVAVAAAGVVAGVAGLGALAMPAGAGPAPVLPQVDAQSLVESVLTAKPAAFGGTVDVNNSLGIPAIAGLPQLSDGASQVRMWTDGQGRSRVSLPTGNSERTIVDDGTTIWAWNSETQSVTKTPRGSADAKPDHDLGLGLGLGEDGKPADPLQVARDVVSEIEKTSTVTVDGTARVANRSAYELVLTPKPTERTVLREVRVAVDSELRLPLRVSLLTNGTDEPAVQVGFSELTVGAQDAGLFQFTPSASAKVEEKEAEAPSEQDKAQAEKALGEASPQIIGDGWDTVVVARTPAETLAGMQLPAEEESDRRGPGREQAGNPQDLLKQLGKPVSGAWGSGTLISSKIGNVLLADDGRVALGAVPEQVLTEAIGQVK